MTATRHVCLWTATLAMVLSSSTVCSFSPTSMPIRGIAHNSPVRRFTSTSLYASSQSGPRRRVVTRHAGGSTTKSNVDVDGKASCAPTGGSKKHVAILLAGCGVYDGSECTEAVSSILVRASYVCRCVDEVDWIGLLPGCLMTTTLTLRRSLIGSHCKDDMSLFNSILQLHESSHISCFPLRMHPLLFIFSVHSTWNARAVHSKHSRPTRIKSIQLTIRRVRHLPHPHVMSWKNQHVSYVGTFNLPIHSIPMITMH